MRCLPVFPWRRRSGQVFFKALLELAQSVSIRDPAVEVYGLPKCGRGPGFVRIHPSSAIHGITAQRDGDMQMKSLPLVRYSLCVGDIRQYPLYPCAGVCHAGLIAHGVPYINRYLLQIVCSHFQYLPLKAPV